jgi:hypothetical protein
MTKANSAYLVYEDSPRYDPQIKWVVAAILSLTLIPGIILLYTDIMGAWVLLVATALDALLFYIIIPRQYQVFSDKVKIVLGGPFSINLPFSSIKRVHSASNISAYIYWGLRMAPSAKGVIEIVRQPGIDVVISPRDSVTFVQQLKAALNTFVID